MITLILARHGETDWNRDGRLAGLTDKPVLTKKGKKQAEALAKKLQDLAVDVVYSSRLKRAAQTAQIIAKTLDKKIIYSKYLNERSWGIYEGKDKESVFKKLDQMDVKRRFDYKPIGGESWREFEKKLLKFFKRLIGKNEGQTVLVITHGGTIRALFHILKNVNREKSLDLKFHNTSLTTLKMVDGRVEEELINDISHLKPI
ncbi:histidine phosphatase family protein [Candidatus Curtissbacteria bacterium]|nr:histidine phosphatase family protein [Candidatus Curtissbacteria bacterium]